MNLVGVDLGGTKCVVVLAEISANSIPKILWKSEKHRTLDYSPQEMLELLAKDVEHCFTLSAAVPPSAIGISCGGPLNSKDGIILSPPNMKFWDNIAVSAFFEDRFSVPCRLCNDANAGALVEWKWGAGRNYQNVIFMTFGTGMGAGLILNGKLYEGASDMAGEIGHVRISQFGPSGYGKIGSFEGFCSGGGIAQLADTIIEKHRQTGDYSGIASLRVPITAETVGQAAKNDDPIAIEILQESGNKLGYGLSILVDILNPEVIIIGSIFSRCQKWLWPAAEKVIASETLASNRRACTVVPAELDEHIGDYASIAVACECISK